MKDDFTFPLTFKFRSARERQQFIYQWFNQSGDYLFGVDVIQDAESPSWQGENPEFLCQTSSPFQDDYDAADAYTGPFSTNFAKPE